MNNLTNIKIQDNVMTFTIDYAEDLTAYTKLVYVDEVWNLKNILNDCPAHNYKIDETITVDRNNDVTVTNDLILKLDWNMKYVTLVCTKEDTEIRFYGVYYEPNIVYQAELRKLHSYCQTCLDDRTMLDIMLIVFKRQLLEYAIKGEHFKDAMLLYVDICRLLNISIQDSYNHSVNCCTNCILTLDNNCVHAENERCLHADFDRPRSECSSCNSCCNGCCSL